MNVQTPQQQFRSPAQQTREASNDDAWVPSSCALCYGTCSILAHRVNGVVVKIEGNPESAVGKGRLCGKGVSGIMTHYDPNRLRYPLQVFKAMRAVWPQDKPMSVRISAHDWVDGGTTPDDAVEIARAFKAAGADMIDVSSGQVSKEEKPVFGRMFQTPFADRIRNEAGIATIAVGAISEADHVNSIIAAGRADLCAIARPHLANPSWTLNEAAKIGYFDVAWPKQYAAAKSQLERNLERERAMAADNARLTPQERAQRAEGTV